MELHILSLSEALAFMPVRSTYGVRIYSSSQRYERDLQRSPLYRRIVEYTFDDNDERYKAGPVDITKGVADAIVRDFAEWKDSVEALLVHCTRGRNRSPAVAIALNEIFGLGHDSFELKRRFNESNLFVYKMILEAGQRRQI